MAFSILELINFLGTVNFGFITPDIVAVIIAVVFSMLITRDVNKILILLAPMSIFIESFGFKVNTLAITLFALIFVISIFTSEGFNEFVNTTDSQ